jgi:hypothetical protein
MITKPFSTTPFTFLALGVVTKYLSTSVALALAVMLSES